MVEIKEVIMSIGVPVALILLFSKIYYDMGYVKGHRDGETELRDWVFGKDGKLNQEIQELWDKAQHNTESENETTSN
jgi:hypothetical protein